MMRAPNRDPDHVEIEVVPRAPRASARMLMLGVLVSGALLWLALRDVDGARLWSTLHSGDLSLLGLTFIAWTLSYAARAKRWQLLLGPDVPVATSFWGICAGYVGNTFLPARAGEAIRTFLVARASGKRIGFVAATVMTERVADVIAMSAIMTASIALIGSDNAWLRASASVAGTCAIVGVVALFAAPTAGRLVGRAAASLPVMRGRAAQVEHAVEGFVVGMRALGSVPVAWRFCLWTAVVISLEVTGVASAASSFGLALTLGQILLFLAAMAFASALPSTPGYVGVYQFVAVAVLGPFGIGATDAVTFSIGLQAVNILVVLICGGTGLWRLRQIRRKLLQHGVRPAGT